MNLVLAVNELERINDQQDIVSCEQQGFVEEICKLEPVHGDEAWYYDKQLPHELQLDYVGALLWVSCGKAWRLLAELLSIF